MLTDKLSSCNYYNGVGTICAMQWIWVDQGVEKNQPVDSPLSVSSLFEQVEPLCNYILHVSNVFFQVFLTHSEEGCCKRCFNGFAKNSVSKS